MKFLLSHGNKNLDSIITTADVYSEIEPSFFITFKNTVSLKEVKDFIFRVFSDVKCEELNIRPDGHSFITNGYCVIFKTNHFRTVVDRLYQQAIVSTSERSDIEPYIIEFEQIIANRPLVTTEINKMQEDTIRFMVSPYIENFSAIEDPYLSLALMARSMLKCLSDIGKDSDNLIYTQNKSLLNYIKTSLPDVKQREEIYNSIGAIAKLFHGCQDMISTFIRLGNNIPDKKIQCNIIKQELYIFFNHKFNLDGHKELKLLSYLALSGYNKHIKNINWSDPQQALKIFIDSINDKKNYENHMIFQYSLSQLILEIKNALKATGISLDEPEFAKLISPEQLQSLSSYIKPKFTPQ